jgi:uncharacterized protein with PIN domain
VVVDTSVLVAILLGEPERDRFIQLLADADDPGPTASTLAAASPFPVCATSSSRS